MRIRCLLRFHWLLRLIARWLCTRGDDQFVRAPSYQSRWGDIRMQRWHSVSFQANRHAGQTPRVSKVFQQWPQTQYQRWCRSGCQLQSGQRMRRTPFLTLPASTSVLPPDPSLSSPRRLNSNIAHQSSASFRRLHRAFRSKHAEMVCPCRAWRVLPMLVATLAFSDHAQGQDRSNGTKERVRVELSVPDSCAQGERFWSQVRERLGTAWEAAPGELARTIRVTVAVNAGRYVARIELTDARGRQVVRAVAGAECEQVIDSIALITVLAIQAQVDELISRSEPSETSSPATEPAPSDPSTKPATPSKPDDSLARAPPPTAEPAASTPMMKLRLGGRAGIQQGVGPGVATIFGGFFGVAWPQVALGLALDAGGTGWVRAQDVRAEFDLLAGRLEGCWRLRTPEEALSVEPCVFVQGGVLSGQAARQLPGVSQGRRGSTLWLAPGLLAAMRGELGPVFLGLEASGAVSLNQESFFVEVETRTVYQVPWITVSVALGAGVVF